MAIGTSNYTQHPSGLTKRQRDEQVRQMLLNDRSSFESTWRELAEFNAPRRPRFDTSDRNKGDRRTQSIIDSAPRMALRTLQSGMHAGMTSPARPWMKLTTADADLAEHGAVKQWLHTVTQRMLTVFLRSNLYNALPTVYGDMGLFATAAISIVDDDEDLMRAYCYPIGSYVVGLDARGLAATFAREYRLTVRQVVTQFGVEPGSRDIDRRRFSTQVLEAWDRGDYETPVDVVWFVTPNEEHDPRKLEAKYKPFRSCYYELGAPDAKDYGADAAYYLRESGFDEFPVLVPRWDVTAEDTYGTDCPGLVMLGDVKQLQLMQRRKAQAIEKAVNPPLIGPGSLRTQEVSTLPGRITYGDEREGMHGLRPIHEVRLEGLQYLIQDMTETRGRCREACFADLFLMLAQSDNVQPITAAEVAARQEEKLIALGPVLERTNDELLDRLVDRVFAMMLRAGAIPEPPQELAEQDLKVEYLSIMAQAQKLVGVVGQDRFITSVIQMAQVWPDAALKVNAGEVVDRYGDMLGVAPSLVHTDEEFQAKLQQQAQQAQGMAQAAQAKDLAGAAQSLGNTPLQRGGSALDAVLNGEGAAA